MVEFVFPGDRDSRMLLSIASGLLSRIYLPENLWAAWCYVGSVMETRAPIASLRVWRTMLGEGIQSRLIIIMLVHVSMLCTVHLKRADSFKLISKPCVMCANSHPTLVLAIITAGK